MSPINYPSTGTPNGSLSDEELRASPVPVTGTFTGIVSGAVRLTDGTVDATLTTVGPKIGLDANIIGGVVSGTFQPTGLQVAGKTTMLSIDSSAWYAAPVTPLTGRNNIEIQNPSTSTSDMLWVYDNTVGATVGFHVTPGSSRSIAIKGSIPVYVRMVSGAATVVVEELA